MFFNICFWFCGMIFETPTIEKMTFLSSTVAIRYLLFYYVRCVNHGSNDAFLTSFCKFTKNKENNQMGIYK